MLTMKRTNYVGRHRLPEVEVTGARPRVVRRAMWITGLAAIGAAGFMIAVPPHAHADNTLGCQTDRWGFLGSQRRTLCDTPRAADGSWNRVRMVWTPAHYVPFSCYGGAYYSSCSGGYSVNESVQTKETYPVNDGNVLPDEPGWLPTGTDVIR